MPIIVSKPVSMIFCDEMIIFQRSKNSLAKNTCVCLVIDENSPLLINPRIDRYLH
jgi:hypothetical protein